MHYTYEDYLIEVEMSQLAHVLLEGPHDKIFFIRLVRRFCGSEYHNQIAITTAQELRSDAAQPLGNQEKVEHVSSLINQEHYRNRFLGFVDRELREFTFDHGIQDNLRTHYRNRRLVWSRGHSIENYMFDFQILRATFIEFASNENVAKNALKFFEEHFQQLINIACAIGLAAKECRILKIVRNTLYDNVLLYSNGTYEWNTAKWRQLIVKRSPLDETNCKNLLEAYEKWLEITENSEPVNVRWACDGHIGMKLIWVAIAQVVYESARRIPGVEPSANNQRKEFLKPNDIVRLNFLSSNWAQSTTLLDGDSPAFCLDMIGLRRQPK